MSGREQDNGELRLSAALAVAREQWPDGAALERVRRGVAAAVSSTSQGQGRLQARLLRHSMRAWLRGGALILLVGAGLGALRLGAEPAVQQTPQPLPATVTVARLPAVQADAPAVLPEPAAAPAPRIDSGEARRKARRAQRAIARGPAAAPAPLAAAAPAAAPDPEAELALLRRALAALAQHPSQSLELASEHERDFPNGIFVQEREVIAIDALLALQQTSAAESRARAFLARHPRSAHAPRIRALLGRQGQGVQSPPQMALGR